MADTQAQSIAVTPVPGRVHVYFDEAEIASSLRAVRLDVPGQPSRVFLPLEDIHPGILEASETKRSDAGLGEAHFYTIKTLTADGPDEAWYYPYAEGDYAGVRDLLTFAGDRIDIQYSNV